MLLVGGVIGTGLGFVGQRQMRIAADTLRVRAEGLAIQADQRAAEAEAAKIEIARQKSVTDQALADVQAARVAEAEAEADALGKYEAIKEEKAVPSRRHHPLRRRRTRRFRRDKAASFTICRTRGGRGVQDSRRDEQVAAMRPVSRQLKSPSTPGRLPKHASGCERARGTNGVGCGIFSIRAMANRRSFAARLASGSRLSSAPMGPGSRLTR